MFIFQEMPYINAYCKCTACSNWLVSDSNCAVVSSGAHRDAWCFIRIPGACCTMVPAARWWAVVPGRGAWCLVVPAACCIVVPREAQWCLVIDRNAHWGLLLPITAPEYPPVPGVCCCQAVLISVGACYPVPVPDATSTQLCLGTTDILDILFPQWQVHSASTNIKCRSIKHLITWELWQPCFGWCVSCSNHEWKKNKMIWMLLVFIQVQISKYSFPFFLSFLSLLPLSFPTYCQEGPPPKGQVSKAWYPQRRMATAAATTVSGFWGGN